MASFRHPLQDGRQHVVSVERRYPEHQALAVATLERLYIAQTRRHMTCSAERHVDTTSAVEANLAQSVAAHGELLYARSKRDEFEFQIRAMHEYESSRRIARIGQHIVATNAGI